jgi:hypothetical protein
MNNYGLVELESDDSQLIDGFNWAKRQALSYVNTGDPVGKWYEAALPGRYAFCMRDVSHQATGAQILGLTEWNKNMLMKFAANISESKDWCSYWEIDKYDRPAPVDYVNDQNFWYCLPANFDILDCCYRQYLWTGDNFYLNSSFIHFYDITVGAYVEKWDINGNGLMEHISKYGRRGLATYDESNFDIMLGGDLIAAQYAGYLAYANIQEILNNEFRAAEYRIKANELKQLFNNLWWDAQTKNYRGGMLQNYSFDGGSCALFALYFGITEDGEKTMQALKYLIKNQPKDVEGKSYLPEILYKFGCNYEAYGTLLELTNPSLKRREYPEVSYSVIGAIGTGMIGIHPDARKKMIKTIPRLTKETEWVKIQHVPVFNNEISVCHKENSETTFINNSGPAVKWKASFPGEIDEIRVNGSKIKAKIELTTNNQKESFVIVDVKPSESHTVSIE